MNRAYWIVGILLAGTILGFWASNPGYATEPVYGVSTGLDSSTNAAANSITAPNFYGGTYHGDGSNLVNVPSAASELTLFLTNTLSATSPYRKLTPDSSTLAASEITLTNTVIVTDTLFYNAVTDTEVPSVNYLEGGVYSMHIHASKTGTKTVGLYWKLFIYNGTGEETVATSETETISTTMDDYEIHINIPDTVLETTDRYGVKVYVTVSGSGANPVVSVGVEGTSISHLSLMGPDLSANAFLPAYTNATTTHGIQAANLAITPYYAGTIANSYTIDFSQGGIYTATMTNTVATLFAFTNVVDGGFYSLFLTQPELANSTIVWPTEVLWEDGTAPTFTNTNGARDLFQFMAVNSSAIIGAHVPNLQ